MSINIGPPAVEELRPRITVIGVGGAGGNAIANMITAEIEGVDFIVANTDAQALNNSIAEHRIQLGPEITQGLGAGSRPEVGRAAAEETAAEIERALDGVHMCFIAAGMGGGTGTGAAPVIAKAARDKGVLTVGVVTKPFLFEGTRRMRSADAGIEELQKHVDTLIVIPNQNLFLIAKAETTFKEAFQLADEVLQQGVRSITDLMVMPGLINLDFADVRSVMAEMGKAMMGTGEGSGENRALEAAERAIANPLLDGVSMKGAKGVIISIIGGDDMKLLEVDEAANHIRELVDPNANIIWGSAFNPDLQGKIRVSVVATGIEQTDEMAIEAARPLNLGSSRGPSRPSLTGASSESLFGNRQPEAAPAPQAYEPAPEEPLELATEAAGWSDEGEPETAEDADAAVSSTTGDPLDLAEEYLPEQEPDATGGDELLLDASRLAESDEPVSSPLVTRKRPLVSGDSLGVSPGAGAGSGAGAGARSAPSGNTLFERMANLSRGRNAPAEEEDGDDSDSGSISIPRFLGRQNNQ
jgi:cell division protein FtsZ